MKPIRLTASTVAAILTAGTLAATEPAHLTAGLQLVDEINTLHAQGVFVDPEGTALNTYGGSWNSNSDPSFIRFLDAGNGVYPANNTKCAPLVTHLLQHAYGWNWNNHPFLDPTDNFQLDTSASPNPWQYLELINQGVGFASAIADVRQALPGDIVSIHYVGTTSGHTVILVDLHPDEALPYPQSGSNLNPALAGTTFLRVTVLDSTNSPHSNDSRQFTVVDENDHAVAHEITGAGTGDMGLFIDANGAIVGHTWSLPTADYHTRQSTWIKSINSRLKLQPDRTAVIGRLPAMP